MSQKFLKKFFLAFIKLNKKVLISALLFFVVFGLILPLLASAAAWWDVPGKIGEAIANAIAAPILGVLGFVIFSIPLYISSLILGIVAIILGHVISPDFISWKFTDNPFVNAGLNLTRDFANMGFVLFLAVIALATALRIQEYKAKKTLPILIIIALLVNFTPVFCGVIIDASNIAMFTLLKDQTGINGFLDAFGVATDALGEVIEINFNIKDTIEDLARVVVLIIFNYFAAFILILFIFLFIMRYVMLWILVILSPIAFVSYILPITRRGIGRGSLLNWRAWWQQFIAWSIIGIIAAFFVYLANHMFNMIGGLIEDFSDVERAGLGLLDGVLPYLIPLVLLWIGYREAKKTSAIFAREIIEMPEKVAKGAATAAAIAATSGAAMAAGGALKGAMGTLASAQRFGKFKEKHPRLATVASPFAKSMQWGKRRVTGAQEWAGRVAKEHPRLAAAGRGLKAAFWEYEKKIKPKEEEISKRAYKIYEKRKKEGKPGTTEADWKQAEKELTIKIKKPGIIMPTKEGIKTVRKGIKTALEDFIKKRGATIPLEKEKDIEKIESALIKKEREEALTEEELRELPETLRKIWEEQGREPTSEEFRRELAKIRKAVERKRPTAPPAPAAPPAPPPTTPTAPKPKKKPPRGRRGV
ncbi:DUF2934 domain-containing protein [Patescibacteria group bacterium]|nr:DUF2934 domain-containing protein [Patescibacteria group bacterium]